MAGEPKTPTGGGETHLRQRTDSGRHGRWDAASVPEQADYPDDLFTCSANAPNGARFFIQVVPSFGSVGPTFLAFGDSLRQGPILRLVNRLLVRVQPPARRVDGHMLLVTRVDDDEQVLIEDCESLGAGRERALEVAHQIRSGTFSPDA